LEIERRLLKENYVEAYRTWSAFRSDVDVSYAAYGGGYAIYVLNVDDDANFNTKRRGDCPDHVL
jgi:hypothetical protein